MSKKIHFMGIGGSGISGVAYLAERMGYIVSGCDIEDGTAYANNIKKGHDKSHIKDVDIVVISPALLFKTPVDPEVLEAKNTNKLVTWQEFLGKTLLKGKKVIAIAGTHGKSTTTAMAAKLLIDNGFDPIAMVGAKVPEWGGNARYGEGEYAVIEADEFNNNFLNYHPEIAIINNIEFDHPDFFNNENEVRKSFTKFVDNLQPHGILILNWNDDGIRQTLLNKADPSVARSYQNNQKFDLKIFGKHNQTNASMVYRLGIHLGIPEKAILKSLEAFTGIGRRMELIADRGGVKVYDDYAHHPTAIKTTLDGVREKYPNEKILVIVEPHGYKRTKALLRNYKGVFDTADKVIIGPIFKSRDEIDNSITPQIVAKASNHKDVIGLDSYESVIENCKLIIGNYDIVVVMGAGKSYQWAKEIANLLPVSFSDVTTFRVGGKIKKYIEIKSKEEILGLISKIKNEKLFIIGGGSDVLVSDGDFDGVVIKYTGNKVLLENSNIIVEAGMEWDRLVEFAVENNLQGIECLSGIPGTVGGSPVQNIGAYGQELKTCFVSLEAFDIDNEKFVIFENKDCKFGYRDSIFKSKDFWQKYIIISVTLKLIEDGKPEVKYDSLKNYLSERNIKNPSLKQVREAVLQIRKGKFEDPNVVGNAGSFFQNPIIDNEKFKKIISKHPDLKYFEQDGIYKIFAGWLIEQSGWKGKVFGGAGVSPQHALILINKSGHAKAQEIFDLSEKIIEDVYRKFEIKLVREVQLINF